MKRMMSHLFHVALMLLAFIKGTERSVYKALCPKIG